MATTSLQVSVGYCQYTLEWAEWDPDAVPYKGGNGLVWVTPGRIVVMTGLDNGDVPVEFTTHDNPPPLDLDPWDDVVEVSADINATSLSVFAPVGIHIADVDLPPSETNTYRLRLHARGRDQGREAFSVEADEGEPMVEQHLILIWPAPPTPEKRHKLTDTVGAETRSQK